jgi:hypothetical protein
LTTTNILQRVLQPGWYSLVLNGQSNIARTSKTA